MYYSALIGNPVQHSISPQLFYEISKILKIEYAHLKITVPSRDDLKKTIDSFVQLGFCGINITCPYKLDTYQLLRDSELSLEAKKIKSVNSIVIHDGKLMGYNTDGLAALLSIQKFYPLSSENKVVILGAGGASYSILYEISKITNHIVVFNEYYDRAKEMIHQLNLDVECYDFSDEDIFIEKLNGADLIINATSVGMVPNSKESLISEDIFKKITSGKCFFDVIFNPWDTKLLELAGKYHHLTISGGYMLIYQAYLVLQLWLRQEFVLSDEDIEYLVTCMKKELENE